MRLARKIAFTLVMATVASMASQAQAPPLPASIETKIPVERFPFEIVSYKIGADYYPMLDRPSMTSPQMTAETGDMPQTENERLNQQRTRPSTKNTAAPIAPGDTRLRGRIRTYTRVIDEAQFVQVVLKNTEANTVKSIVWDFAYPRYEDGVLILRHDVTSKAEIKPNGKKTLKYKLPAGVKKCEVVRVVKNQDQSEKVNTFEAVCGLGFSDPSLLNQKLETITIKRIEYSDGTVWQRNN